MEIVIKIDQKDYNLAYDLISGVEPKFCRDRIYKAIVDGTVLPEGHGRLIDVNDLVASLEKDTREAFTKHQVWLMFSVYNKDVPTVIEAD